MTRPKSAPVLRVVRLPTGASKDFSIREAGPAHLMLVELASIPPSSSRSSGELGGVGWPGERRGRVSSSNGGGDYAAQMLLGRMRRAKVVEYAPSSGSTMWRITAAGRAAVKQLAGG